MTGRPTLYTDEWAEQIIEWIADGKTLRAFLREHEGKEGLPAWRTVHDWVRNNEEFSKRYREARLLGFDALAENLWEKISQAPPKDKLQLGHWRLQVDTMLKLLAKWDPKRYGELMKLGAPDGGPLKHKTLNVNAVPANAVEAMAFYKDMIEADDTEK